jgi:photosystem II stability/assembly factor-like uncharacterized protein
MKSPRILLGRKLLGIFSAVIAYAFVAPGTANAQWVATNGPGGGAYVGALAVNGIYLFAGTTGGGAFRTTDSGASWTAVNNGLTSYGVYAFANLGNKLFAGTYQYGVFRSSDSGASWTAVNNGLTDLYNYALAVIGNNLFTGGTYGGVFRSTDSGASWTEVNRGHGSNCINAFAVIGTDLFAGAHGGVSRTRDSGASWTDVNNGLANSDVHALAVSGSTLFAGTYGGVFRSTNSGANWTAVNNGLGNLVVKALAVSGTNLFAGTQGGIFRSTNSGTTWIAFNNGLTDSNSYSFAVYGTKLYTGTSGGTVWRWRLNIPVLIPCAPNPTTSHTPRFRWYSPFDSSISVYRIQVADNQQFSSLIVSTAVTDTFFIPATELPIDTLFWRVGNDTDTSEWSTISSVTIVYPKPIVIPYTPNPTTNRRPQVRWRRNDSIPVFRIQIDTTQQFTSPIVSTATTDTFFTPADDLPFDTIYWRVGNVADPLAWSAISSVRIVRAVPTIIAYTPNPTYNRRPQLRWNRHDSIPVFRIQIDTTQQFTSPIVSTTTTDTFFIPADNLPFDTIYWRVGNDADSLAWSAISSVRVVRAVPTIIAYTPNPTYNHRPQLRWYRHDSIPVFRIQIDTTNNFISPIVSTTTTDTFFTPVDNLPLDTIYWRVGNEADPLAWSTVSSFRIIGYVPTLIPYTPNPTTNRLPKLRWYRNDSIPLFRIQIADNQQFTSPVVSQTLTDTFYTPASDLAFGTIYWRVGNEINSQLWSAISTLGIMDSSGAIKGWTVVSPPPTNNNLASVAFGNGLYVAVGDGNSTILTSPDGISWTSQTSGTSYPLAFVAYGNGRFVILSNAVLTHDAPNPLSGYYTCYLNNYSFTSTDGVSWTMNSAGCGFGGPSCCGACNPGIPATGIYFATYINSSHKAEFIGTIDATLVTSSDGSSWSIVEGCRNMTTNPGYFFAYGNGWLVALSGNHIQTYPDSLSLGPPWTSRTSGATRNLNSVVFGTGQFTVVGDSGTILTSSDVSTWTSRASGMSVNLKSVTYGNGQHVTVGSSGIILNSPDGISWAFDLSGTVNNLNSVATNGSGQFVAVGNSGTIVVSSSIPTAINGMKNPALLSTVLKAQTRNSFLTISLPSAMLGKAVDVAVYNSMGRKIMGSNVRSASGRFSLPTPNLALGTYILVVNDGSRKVSVKFVAMR